MRLTGRAAVAVGVTSLLMLWGAAPACAHDTLIASSPKDGETVAVVPTELTLTFSNNALALGTQVVVNGPGGEAQTGTAVVDGPVVRQRLADTLPAGSYEVVWRVVSSDGHPITDSFTFVAASGRAPVTSPTTAAASTSPLATATAAPVVPSPSSSGATSVIPSVDTEESGDDTTPLSPWLLGGGAVAAVVAAGLVWRRRR